MVSSIRDKINAYLEPYLYFREIYCHSTAAIQGAAATTLNDRDIVIPEQYKPYFYSSSAPVPDLFKAAGLVFHGTSEGAFDGMQATGINLKPVRDRHGDLAHKMASNQTLVRSTNLDQTFCTTPKFSLSEKYANSAATRSGGTKCILVFAVSSDLTDEGVLQPSGTQFVEEGKTFVERQSMQRWDTDKVEKLLHFVGVIKIPRSRL